MDKLLSYNDIYWSGSVVQRMSAAQVGLRHSNDRILKEAVRPCCSVHRLYTESPIDMITQLTRLILLGGVSASLQEPQPIVFGQRQAPSDEGGGAVV